MFIKLGILNSQRQLGRSMLVLLAMALSAVSLTSAMSFSDGAMAGAAMTYRQIFGGEIIAFPVRWAGQQNDDITGDGLLNYQRLERNRLSWMEWLYPELYDKGFLTYSESSPGEFFAPADLEAMQQLPGIKGVSTFPQLPASIVTEAFGERGMPVAVMPAQPGYLPGRGFTQQEQQNAAPVAIPNAIFYAPKDQVEALAAEIPDEAITGPYGALPFDEIQRMKYRSAESSLKDSMCLPPPGKTMTLALPQLRITGQGVIQPIFTDSLKVDLTVVSKAAIPTRTIVWLNPIGNQEEETSYLHAPIVWVPVSTWDALWQKASGGLPYVSSNVSLQVEDMGKLDSMVVELQNRFPDYTFVSVPNLQYRAESLNLLDRFFRAPRHLWDLKGKSTLAVPVELGRVMGMLMYLVAGMLIASRMLTGASARRKEIGVLKALGARRKDITVMALTEAFLITIMGSTAGFAVVRLGAIFKQISNDVPMSIILNGTVSEYGMVVGVATAISMLFALIPAVRMANLTVMEVLRND